jgi:hypothetical protein
MGRFMSLTQAEKTELTTLFSNLVARIHDLPLSNIQALWDIDERMKGDRLSAEDLKRLRELFATVASKQR